MPVCRTLDEIWAQGAVDGLNDPPLSQAQADFIAAILAPYREHIAALGAAAAPALPEPTPPAPRPGTGMLTVAEAAGQLGIGRTKLYELIRKGDIEAVDLNHIADGEYGIPGRRTGKHRALRIEQAEIDRFKARSRARNG